MLSDNNSIRNFEHPQVYFCKREKFRGRWFSKMELSGMKGIFKSDAIGICIFQNREKGWNGGVNRHFKVKYGSNHNLIPWNGHFGTVNCHLDIVNCQLDTVNCQLDTVNCQLDTVSCQLDTVNCQLDIVNCQLDTVNCHLGILRECILKSCPS